jgi:hypothetical protein
MSVSPPPADPRHFVREFRANFVNLYNLWTGVEPLPSGVDLKTPAQRPLAVGDIPEGARSLLAEYTRRRRGYRVELIKYLRAVDGEPVEVVEDERDLPEEDELITLSQTSTLATATQLRVVTEVLVGRLVPAAETER